MPNTSDTRRRWMGAIFLGTSALMLVAGVSFLGAPLKTRPWLLLLYWVACFGFVLGAIFIAFLDLAIMRRRLRAEQRGLVEETLQNILKQERADQGTAGSGKSTTDSAELRN